MHYYETFKGQLVADIVASQGFTAANPVKFGRPLVPIRNVSHAVVSTTIARALEGRSVEETYSFSIALRVLKSEIPPTDDAESYLFTRAAALVDRLAPNDPAEPPVYANFAGVGYSQEVTAVEATDGQETDHEKLVTVVVDFTVKAKVYQ